MTGKVPRQRRPLDPHWEPMQHNQRNIWSHCYNATHWEVRRTCVRPLKTFGTFSGSGWGLYRCSVSRVKASGEEQLFGLEQLIPDKVTSEIIVDGLIFKILIFIRGFTFSLSQQKRRLKCSLYIRNVVGRVRCWKMAPPNIKTKPPLLGENHLARFTKSCTFYIISMRMCLVRDAGWLKGLRLVKHAASRSTDDVGAAQFSKSSPVTTEDRFAGPALSIRRMVCQRRAKTVLVQGHLTDLQSPFE